MYIGYYINCFHLVDVLLYKSWSPCRPKFVKHSKTQWQHRLQIKLHFRISLSFPLVLFDKEVNVDIAKILYLTISPPLIRLFKISCLAQEYSKVIQNVHTTYKHTIYKKIPSLNNYKNIMHVYLCKFN